MIADQVLGIPSAQGALQGALWGHASRIIQTTVTWVLAIAVVGVAMLWLSGTFRRDKIAPAKLALAAEPAAGKVVVVEQVTRPHQADVVGSVQAELRTTIASRLMANIMEMRVRAGDSVKKGDVLVVLDDRDLRARVAQAREALRAAEATRDLAKIEVDRLTSMVQQRGRQRV